MIPNVGYKQSVLVPRQPRPVDLSFSVLRSVSPIHLKYLHNMGVAASFRYVVMCMCSVWCICGVYVAYVVVCMCSMWCVYGVCGVYVNKYCCVHVFLCCAACPAKPPQHLLCLMFCNFIVSCVFFLLMHSFRQ